MKATRLLLPALLLASLLAPPAALSAQRTVLLETFTNVSCPPCATANPITHQFVEDFGAPLVLNLQYHVSWPSASDPFYLTDTADNSGRRAYYGISSVPDLFTDGQDAPAPGSYYGLVGTVRPRLGLPSPLEITVSATIVGSNITVDADVTAVDDVPGSSLVLRIALVEPYVHFGSPPGSNGEVDFYCSMRDMLPSHAGTGFTISNGQMLHFSESGTLDPSWQDIYAVVWVQNDTTQEVLQAASSLAKPDFAFYYGCQQTADIVQIGELRSFHSLISNVGQSFDMYDVHIDKNLPGDWSASVCANGTCFPPWITDFTMELDPGAQDSILVDIQPMLVPGSGTVTITATSMGDNNLSWSQTYKVISSHVPILVVDDDGGEAYESYFSGAIDPTGYLYATWDLDSFGKLSASMLDYFHTIVWNVGWSFPSLDADDRAALGSYLDNHGTLFVTGQDIGWDLCDPSSDNYSAAAVNWYRTYLGANYVSDDTNDLTIIGQTGDPIGDGLSFNIFGGDGANNQDYPSEIDPYGGGQACLLYSPDREAAVHLQSGNFQTCYFAFGFEGIATQTDRNTLMDRILDWFDVDLVGVPDDRPARPVLASLPEATPNPFNPSTTIKFALDGDRPATLSVVVFDLRGHRVRTLFRGPVQPGPQSFSWDGHNDGGREVASGTYLARVVVDGSPWTVKMTLAK